MKRMLVLVVAAALLWSGYWLWSARAQRAAVDTWLAERTAAGWVAEAEAVIIRGFPNRIDTELTQPRLADPDTGTVWSAPWVQMFQLVYKPNHAILAFPNTQSLTLDGTAYDISSDGLRASLVTQQNAVERLNIEAKALSVSGQWAMSEMTTAVLRQKGTPSTYRIAIQSAALATAGAAPSPALPDSFRGLRVDMLVDFDRPFQVNAPGVRPQPQRATLRLAEYLYGDLEVKLAGEVDVDNDGRISGQLTLKAVNWPELVTMAQDAGLLPDALSEAVTQGLGLIAGLSGNRETLDVPLTFRDGQMSLGPIPLGPAPRLRLP